MMAGLGFTSGARAQGTISTGHADIFGLGFFAPDELELLIHAEDGMDEVELDPALTTIQVNAGGYVLRPPGASFDFLGASGTSLWILPQSETEASNRGVLFAGIGTEEVDPVEWGFGNPITITLLNVASAPAGGNFFLWKDDEFGEPTQFMNSTDLGTYNSVAQDAGGHEHYNWGFTAEGIYEIEFEATGTPEGGSPLSSGVQTYTFNVVPEPSTYALLGLSAGAVGLMRWRKRRRQK